MKNHVLISVIAILLWGCGPTKVDFNADIRPVLNNRCVTCHGGVKTNADLNLQFRELALLGGESGLAAIVPGDPDGSELIKRITHANPSDRMPKDDGPLTEEEVQLFRDWIKQGAEWDTHWAYRQPVLAAPLEETAKGASAIDGFVQDKLNELGLEQAEEASCAILARRVSLDLTGLPATYEQAQTLCETGQYEQLVDELLASPSFGERWAALWLDLARYADSKGYEADRERSIWRYRDWLIKAFNEDLPFDQFTIEQLAGDLLPNPTTDQLIATAFSRNTMTNEEGGTDDEEHRFASIVDRVNTTWEVFQGTTMRCVQCHGHPYDPFVQEDFYASFAIFNNTADWDQAHEEPVLREFAPAHRQEGKQLLAELKKVNKALQDTLDHPVVAPLVKSWEKSLDNPTLVGMLLNTSKNEIRRIAAKPDSARSPYESAFLKARIADADPMFADLRAQRSDIYRKIGELSPTITPIMQELPANERRITRRAERGSFLSPLEVVEPGIPKVMETTDGIKVTDRLSFAQWLVSDENPLTARVTVNRFWEQLFGFGLVESSDDFGTIGIAPTHPELLDWLALRFQKDLKWSQKALLKDIVMSATYRQSSDFEPLKLERDPRNQYYSRGPRFRLSAEQLRDQSLAVSGLLSGKQFGKSVMPFQPEGLWSNPYNGQQWTLSQGEDRHRRALYTYWRRTNPYPSMAIFDAPSREFCVSRRIRTNTPLQALITLNDPAFWEAAEALAVRMKQAGANLSEQVTAGYRLALARDPDENTLTTLVQLAEQTTLPVVANTILNLDEYLTKE